MTLLNDVFGIDYWRATIWTTLEGLEPFLELLGLHEGLTEKGHGGQGYQAISDGLLGFQIYSRPPDGSVRCTISCPAKCMDYVGTERFLNGWKWLCESGLRWHSTRVDFAFDTQSFKVADFSEALQADKYQGAPRKIKENRDLDGGDGHTVYIGTRQSTSQLCVYHKTDGLSFDGEPFTRVELRLYDERADLGLLEVIAAPLEQWAERAAMLLNGFCSVAVDWWQRWIAQLPASWLRLHRAASTVERAQRWLKKAVAPSFAMVVEAISSGDADVIDDFIRELLLDGQSRLSKLQRANVERYRGESPQSFAVFQMGGAGG